MNTSVNSAVKPEGFGSSKLTFKKKVTIEENTFEGENRVIDIYYFWGHFWKGSKIFPGPFKIEYHRITNTDKLQDSLGNTNCDHICYLNFGVVDGIEMPLFKESCNRFKEDVTIQMDIEDYLINATYNEIFFAKSCVVTNGEDVRTISWEFGERDFYHNA